MRTNEALWEKIKQQVTNDETAGTRSGQWSARKAQLAVRMYKDAGGEYVGKKPKSLVKWSKQNWRTKSGLPSHVTGERYLPEKAIEKLSDKEYELTSDLKRKAMESGEQYSNQPANIAHKTRGFRL